MNETGNEARSVTVGLPTSVAGANTLYPVSYGKWAGLPKGHNPDFSRCCEEVREEGRWPKYSQCSRKRGFGPGLAYCKQHDPAVAEARRKKAASKATAKWNSERYQWNGRTFFNALQAIADGHNDARGHAQEVIAEFIKGEHK